MNTRGVYQRLVRADRRDQSQAHQRIIARNGLRQVVANSLQAVGDQVVNAKTVLPWLLASLGAPMVLVGLLVPIRESGSMLPQAALAPMVQRRGRRTTVWIIGAAGQALATAALALIAATLDGQAAGVLLLAALALFSVSRSLCSLAGKDVLGRTVPEGERGQINGWSTVFSGAVAITLGLLIRLLGGDDVSTMVLAALLGAAALAWVLAAVVYRGVREPEQEDPPASAVEDEGWARSAWNLLRSDAGFRRFVVARALLLVSALSPPFVVALSAATGDAGLGSLGPFVMAQGVAALVGGRPFGRWADRSSRRLMLWGAAFATLVVVLFLAVVLFIPGSRELWWIYPAVYLVLVLSHTAVRVARKTYVVDLAEGDLRTRYIAVANTAMGVLLLVAGAISGALAALGPEAALGFLAVLGVAGVVVSHSLPETGKTG
ncbi:MAG: MFS transporter [Micrococcaceae bacterium]|nr:MFS transporter [Micrococcaceae bacterium]MDN5878593.1 MFS transporter [Micrococcaceae bacterium]MDN6168592.1 MFS transporter [Micrococcaceae bacterium]MDN6202367.1 MFS transporter [Micrococcaceae bacterium]